MVGVADTDIERGELGLCLGTRFGRHPRQVVDALAECGDDVFDECLNFGLCLWREIFFDIHLADHIAEGSAGCTDSALRSGSLLRHTEQLFSIKVKILVGERFWQEARGSVDRAK